MASKVQSKDVRDKIIEHLHKDGRRLPWLARKTYISYGHLYYILQAKENRRLLTQENLDKINEALGTSFKL